MAAVALLPTCESPKTTETLIRALTFDSGVNVSVAIGREYSAKQLVAMARTIKPHILIGTPGKVVDLLKTTNATPFASIRLFAFDEANDLLSESKLADVHTIRSYLKAVPTQAYALSFRAPLIKSFHNVFKVIPKILNMGERQREGSRFNEKWKTVASTQLKDVVSLLMDVFPELNLRFAPESRNKRQS